MIAVGVTSFFYREGNVYVEVVRCSRARCSWAYECVVDDFGTLVRVKSLQEW